MGYQTDLLGNRIVAERELQLGQARFLRTDDGSAPMNIDGTPAGAATIIWNGTGAGDTGGDWTASGTGSETAGAMHAGTNGWDSGVAGKDATTVFDSGSMQDIDGSYQTLEFWMNPQAFPGGSFLSLQWLNNVDGNVGSRLDVNSYVTDFDIGVWQQVIIPIADFGLPGNAQKLRFQYRKVAGQHFYLDDIDLLAAGGGGGPYIFEVAAPDANTQYHITMLTVMIVGTASGWDDDTFGNIAGLTHGLLFRHQDLSVPETIVSLNSKDNIDLFGRYHPQDVVDFAVDRMVGFMLKPGKRAALTVTDQKVLQLLVRDDLTGLSNMRAFAHFGIEAAT
jgi:hypothetical protein